MKVKLSPNMDRAHEEFTDRAVHETKEVTRTFTSTWMRREIG